MATRVIVRGRGIDIAAMMTWETPVSFELLRETFQGPMKIMHERNTDTWHVDLAGGEELESVL
jgi:hypothetical protein